MHVGQLSILGVMSEARRDGRAGLLPSLFLTKCFFFLKSASQQVAGSAVHVDVHTGAGE